MPRTKKDERDYAYWTNERDKWVQRALRSFQIQSVSIRVRNGGADYTGKTMKCFSHKITARSLNDVYMSFPPIVDHFTKGKKEYFVSVVLRDVVYSKKAGKAIYAYDINVRCNKDYHTENLISGTSVDNCNYDMITDVVYEIMSAIEDVYYNIDRYEPKTVK